MQTRAFRCRSGLVRACWRFAGVAACILLLADLSRTFLGPRTTEKPLAGRLAAPTPRFPARMPRVPRPAIFAATPAATMFGAACVFLGLQFFSTEDNDNALRSLIQKYTNIEIIDVSPDMDIRQEIASGSSHKLVLRGKSDEDIHWYVQGSKLPKVRWFLRKDTVLRRVLFGGGLALGESYMDGDWESDNVERLVYELLRIEDLTKELGARELPLLGTIVLGALKGKLLELPGQSVEGAKDNIGKTYDVETIKIYEEMLDSNMQYSCGYFYKPDMTLDDAQFAKMELIARKLDLRPGMKLLEIGFGFGSLAYHLASRYDVHIKACTLSQAQMDWAKEHYGHPNIEFMYADYRDVQGKFDRVYSVGMFEHVGRASFATYFDKVYDALADDGIFLLHTLGWAKRGEWNHNGFVGKYIFPGGELPTLYLLTEEFSDRWHLEDFQSFGKSYVQTMRTWLDNLKTWNNMDEFDTRFKRMWEYYLSCCTAAFEKRRIKVWQFVYTKQLSPRLSDCYHIRRDACSIESLARETEAAR
ncbi:cfa [Symbiodinium sp. KB8]|nr:cfa [Symbiodinium sp. KB8]